MALTHVFYSTNLIKMVNVHRRTVQICKVSLQSLNLESRFQRVTLNPLKVTSGFRTYYIFSQKAGNNKWFRGWKSD